MFKWSVEEGRSGGRQILHVRVTRTAGGLALTQPQQKLTN